MKKSIRIIVTVLVLILLLSSLTIFVGCDEQIKQELSKIKDEIATAKDTILEAEKNIEKIANEVLQAKQDTANAFASAVLCKLQYMQTINNTEVETKYFDKYIFNSNIILLPDTNFASEIGKLTKMSKKEDTTVYFYVEQISGKILGTVYISDGILGIAGECPSSITIDSQIADIENVKTGSFNADGFLCYKCVLNQGLITGFKLYVTKELEEEMAKNTAEQDAANSSANAIFGKLSYMQQMQGVVVNSVYFKNTNGTLSPGTDFVAEIKKLPNLKPNAKFLFFVDKTADNMIVGAAYDTDGTIGLSGRYPKKEDNEKKVFDITAQTDVYAIYGGKVSTDGSITGFTKLTDWPA